MKRPQGFDKPAKPVGQPNPSVAPAKPARRGGSRSNPPQAASAQQEASQQATQNIDGTIVVPSHANGRAQDAAMNPRRPQMVPAPEIVPVPQTAAVVPPGTSSAAFSDARSLARADARPTGLPTAWWTSKNDRASEERNEAGSAEAVTEPIAVAHAQASEVSDGAGGAPERAASEDLREQTAEVTGPLAPVTQLNTTAHVGSQASSTAKPARAPAAEPPLDAPLSSSSARARLRAATRARRAYERAEVRRFTRQLRRRRAAWLTSLGAVLALALFVAVGTFSPLMALTTIQVEGTSRLDPAQVSVALDGQLGTPLPLVDLGEIKSGLSQFSLIQSFSTESRPPNTLVVRVVERNPVGAIAGPQGFDLVDPAGVVIQSTPERPAGYPIIEAVGAEGLASAGSVVQSLPEEIRAQLDVVRAESTDNVNFVLADGASIAWGSAEESGFKAAVLAKLIAAASAGGVTMYDVSSPNSPVVR